MEWRKLKSIASAGPSEESSTTVHRCSPSRSSCSRRCAWPNEVLPASLCTCLEVERFGARPHAHPSYGCALSSAAHLRLVCPRPDFGTFLPRVRQIRPDVRQHRTKQGNAGRNPAGLFPSSGRGGTNVARCGHAWQHMGDIWAHSVELRQLLSTTRRTLAKIGQVLAKLWVKHRTRLVQHPKLGQIWPGPGQIWAALAEFGPKCA